MCNNFWPFHRDVHTIENIRERASQFFLAFDFNLKNFTHSLSFSFCPLHFAFVFSFFFFLVNACVCVCLERMALHFYSITCVRRIGMHFYFTFIHEKKNIKLKYVINDTAIKGSFASAKLTFPHGLPK